MTSLRALSFRLNSIGGAYYDGDTVVNLSSSDGVFRQQSYVFAAVTPARHAQFIRMRFTHQADWLLIAEVRFQSGKCMLERCADANKSQEILFSKKNDPAI